ncbi:hypothetical protein DFH11DRAFT_1858379 [Phellopilus nigrolimitatus]|nr:hypothetical protein DFH11DRAFT_1858379 [Phellopilus nigrolimitatus]
MREPLRLSRLPKARALRSINFKRNTPGNFLRLSVPALGKAHDAVVDPSHPWARIPPKVYAGQFPYHSSPALTVRAFPKALLTKPEFPHPDPPFGLTWRKGAGGDGESGEEFGEGTRVDMSLMHSISKKLHKSAMVRAKIKNRLKTALALLFTHNAEVENLPGEGARLVCGEQVRNRGRWVMKDPDWTYVFIPTLEVYRMPYDKLVPLLRKALAYTSEKGRIVEEKWKNTRASNPTVRGMYKAQAVDKFFASGGSSKFKDRARFERNTSERNASETVKKRFGAEREDLTKTSYGLETNSPLPITSHTNVAKKSLDDLLLDDDAPETNIPASSHPQTPIWARPDFNPALYKSPSGLPFENISYPEEAKLASKKVLFRSTPILRPINSGRKK